MYSFNLFEPPPPTRYDIQFTLARIPVRIHPLFWVVGLLFGLSSGGIVQLLVWVAVVFVSILIHELGHALAFRLYGLGSRIVLHFAGGLTVPEPVLWGRSWVHVALTSTQEIVVSLAGPIAGFLFAALAVILGVTAGGSIVATRLFGIIPWFDIFFRNNSFLDLLIGTILWVNLFWGLINLVPIYPLDGGNVARHLLMKYDRVDGMRKSLQVSVVAGAVLAILGLALFRSTYITLLYGLLAFQSYLVLRGYGANLF